MQRASLFSVERLTCSFCFSPAGTIAQVTDFIAKLRRTRRANICVQNDYLSSMAGHCSTSLRAVQSILSRIKQLIRPAARASCSRYTHLAGVYRGRIRRPASRRSGPGRPTSSDTRCSVRPLRGGRAAVCVFLSVIIPATGLVNWTASAACIRPTGAGRVCTPPPPCQSRAGRLWPIFRRAAAEGRRRAAGGGRRAAARRCGLIRLTRTGLHHDERYRRQQSTSPPTVDVKIPTDSRG